METGNNATTVSAYPLTRLCLQLNVSDAQAAATISLCKHGTTILPPSVTLEGPRQHLLKRVANVSLEISDGCLNPCVDVCKFIIFRRDQKKIPANHHQNPHAKIIPTRCTHPIIARENETRKLARRDRRRNQGCGSRFETQRRNEDR